MSWMRLVGSIGLSATALIALGCSDPPSPSGCVALVSLGHSKGPVGGLLQVDLQNGQRVVLWR